MKWRAGVLLASNLPFFSDSNPFMSLRRLLLACTGFFVGVALAIAAESPRVPPLSSELAGQLTLPKISGLPPLAWRIQARPAPGGTLAFDAAATAPGLELQLAFTLPLGEVPGTWRLAPTKIDAAAWWRLSVEQAGIGALPADFEFTGQLTLEGEGQWRGADASGTLHLALAAGTAGSAAQHWSATGLMLDANLAIASSRLAVRTAQLRVDTIQAAGLTARNLLVDVTAAEAGRLAVTRAEVAALGGRIALTPFTLDPAAPAVTSVAEFSGVALGDIATLVPQALKEARGQVAGRVSVNWSLQSGLGPSDGSVNVSSAEPATVRLASSPGLLTGNSPPRIELLPEFTGPLRRWTSIENPAHGMLQRIETGQAPLAVESLSLRLYPDGANGARSAQIEVVARTTGVGDVVEKVTFTVNVSGPLDQVLRLGLDDRAKIRVNAPQ